jgi:hypothetical protein
MKPPIATQLQPFHSHGCSINIRPMLPFPGASRPPCRR